MDPLWEIAAAYERDLMSAHETAVLAGQQNGEPYTAWRLRIQLIKTKIDWLAHMVAKAGPPTTS